MSQFSTNSGNTHGSKQSSYVYHILPTSLLFRPRILKTMLEVSCSSAVSQLGKSGSKGNIFLFSRLLYTQFTVLYVIHDQYQDHPLVLYRRPTFPPERPHVSGSSVCLCAAQEPYKENLTLYFSISLRMKTEGSSKKSPLMGPQAQPCQASVASAQHLSQLKTRLC